MRTSKPRKPAPMLAGEYLETSVTAPTPGLRADAFARAIAASDLDTVKALLTDTDDVNRLRFFGGLTLLHVACRGYALADNGPRAHRARAEAIVDALLAAGADPEARDGLHQMPAAWGSTPALRARMLELAVSQRFPCVTSDFDRIGSSTTQQSGAVRFDPGLSYSCAFIPVSQVAWAPREWRA